MSRVFLRGRCWYADYTDENGHRRRPPLKGVENKTQAKLLLAELVTSASRRRLGLEATPVSTRATVWGLCEWWLDYRCPAQSSKKERSRLALHVKSTELGELQAAKARPEDFEARFAAMEKAGAAPASVNHLRAKLRVVFNRAAHTSPPIFSGPNPLLRTRSRKVPKRHHLTLAAEEVAPFLRRVSPQWRNFFAAAVYLALRKGELAGALKTDVDARARTLLVGHSYKRSTTKGGHVDLLPIPEPLWPFIEAALMTKGPHLFPDEKGRMRSYNVKVGMRLKTALKAAGLVTGYVLSCRWCKERHELAALPAERLRCDDCDRLLWVTPVPRPMRFHDLRHSAATILLRAGLEAHHVQRIMRHANISTTTGTYAHLVVEDLRQAQAGAWSQEAGTNAAPPPSPHASPLKESSGT